MPKTAGKRPGTRDTKTSRPAASTTRTGQRSGRVPAVKSPTAKPPKKAMPKPTAKPARRPASTPTANGKPAAVSGARTITITVPGLGPATTRVVGAVAVPMAAARRALPAERGLPLYAGLGALAVAGALEWPVALGLGIGYAALRRGGSPAPPSASC